MASPTIVEQITYKASVDNFVPSQGGVQQKINTLPWLPTFTKFVLAEIASRRQVQKDVLGCVGTLYHEVCKHAHGNVGMITLRGSDFTPCEFTALVSLFKLQNIWSDLLTWVEEV